MSFTEFSVAYRRELAARPEHWWKLVDIARDGTLTLVYSAKSTVENNAVVLAQWLEDEVEKRAEGVRRFAICLSFRSFELIVPTLPRGNAARDAPRSASAR